VYDKIRLSLLGGGILMTLGQFFQLLSLVMLVVILGLGNQMVTSIALHIILIVFLYGFGVLLDRMKQILDLLKQQQTSNGQ
jgi:hypothetical protein